jgi:hypothetical protein
MKMRVFMGCNPLADGCHRIVTVLLPNGDGVVVDEFGRAFYISSTERKIYEANWQEVDGDYEPHRLLLPVEEEAWGTRKEIKDGKMILSAGVFKREYGQVVEF